MDDLLVRIGFSKGERKVYLALADLGQSTIQRLHERVGMERRSVYDILNKLIERGAVSYVRENRHKVFRITPPASLLKSLEEQEEQIKSTKQLINQSLPAFNAAFLANHQDISVEIFRGKEGLKSAWEDMLNEKMIYWIGASRYLAGLSEYYFASWNRRRIKKKILMHTLLRADTKKQFRAAYAFESVRFLPAEFNINPIVICVYGSKVIHLLYGLQPFAILIESKALAENYKKYHAFLWKL